MPTPSLARLLILTFAISMPIGLACEDDHHGAGMPCEVADDCYPDADWSEIQGTVECLDKVPGGYCTHTCNDDSDCCVADGECPSGIPQVCSPFENSTVKRCFLSCEAAMVGDQDPNAYCHDYAHESFGCRSTGGGNMNRKICAP